VPQRPILAAPQQQGKSDSGAAAGNMHGAAVLRINVGVRGSGRIERKVVVDQTVPILRQSGGNFTATMRSNPPQDTCPRAVGRIHKSICVGIA
jgi:hypothetical protein